MAALQSVTLLVLVAGAFSDGSQQHGFWESNEAEGVSIRPGLPLEDEYKTASIEMNSSEEPVYLQPRSLENIFSIMDESSSLSESASHEKKKKKIHSRHGSVKIRNRPQQILPYHKWKDYLENSEQIEAQLRREKDVEQRRKVHELLLALLKERQRYKEFTDKFGQVIESLTTPLPPFLIPTQESRRNDEENNFPNLASPVAPTASVESSLEGVSTTKPHENVTIPMMSARLFKIQPRFLAIPPEIMNQPMPAPGEIFEHPEITNIPKDESDIEEIIEPLGLQTKPTHEYEDRLIAEPSENTNQFALSSNKKSFWSHPNAHKLFFEADYKKPQPQLIPIYAKPPPQTSASTSQDVQMVDDSLLEPPHDDIPIQPSVSPAQGVQLIDGSILHPPYYNIPIRINDTPTRTQVLDDQDVEIFDDGFPEPMYDYGQPPPADTASVPPEEFVEMEKESLNQREGILRELRLFRQMFEMFEKKNLYKHTPQ